MGRGKSIKTNDPKILKQMISNLKWKNKKLRIQVSALKSALELKDGNTSKKKWYSFLIFWR